MKIIGHMLILNEETFVKHTVLNAASKVDELIIVDSGSTDKTMEIIEGLNLSNVTIYEYNQNCPRYEWRQDEIRNWINEKCVEHGADYIFIQDADELFDYDLYKLAESNLPYYSFLFYDVVFRKFATVFGIHNHVRMWKAGELNWERQFHPMLIYEGKVANGRVNLIEDKYFFHLHRFSNITKKDDKKYHKHIWGPEYMDDFPDDVIIPQCLIKFWEAKGI